MLQVGRLAALLERGRRYSQHPSVLAEEAAQQWTGRFNPDR